MRHAQRLSIALALVLILGLGCATFQDLSPRAQYLAALTWFNDNQEQYLTQYEMASPKVQESWKRTIHPVFDRGDTILQTWLTVLETGQSGSSQASQWQAVQRELMGILLTVGVIDLKEE